MSHDLIVVGAGPAGLGAAAEAAKAGLSVLVLDEFHRPGGRLLGQLHEEPDTGTWFNGLEEAQKVLDEAQAADADIRCGASVWALSHVDGQWVVHASSDGKSYELCAPRVLLATGAAENPIPVPGWTLPGVMSIGAAQIFANVHRVKPGSRCVVVGINVLSLTIARELSLAGVDVLGIVMPPAGPLSGDAGDPSKVMEQMSELARLAPSAWQRAGGWLGRTRLGKAFAPRLYPKEGLKTWGIPIQVRKAALKIIGTKEVEAIELSAVDVDGRPTGRSERVDVDLVCIAGGLYPLAELASGAGCQMAHVDELGGEVPVYGEDLQTSEPGLYVAGNITGVEGAKVALSYGRLAGRSIAAAQGALMDQSMVEVARRAVTTERESAPIRFHPQVDRGRETVQSLAKASLSPGDNTC